MQTWHPGAWGRGGCFTSGRLWPLCAESDTFSISAFDGFFGFWSGRPGSDEKKRGLADNMKNHMCQKSAKSLGSFRFFDFFRVFSDFLNFFGKKWKKVQNDWDASDSLGEHCTFAP